MMQSHRLIIERVDDTSALSNFYCGLPSMDKFIHDAEKGLNEYVRLGLTKLRIVRSGKEIVAIFALSKGTLVLSSFDWRKLDKDGLKISADIFDTKDTYPSIEIDYLAVSKNWRNKGIGHFILNEIALKAIEDDLSATMFLTVEAIETKDYSAVGFYKKFNFVDSDHGMTRNQNMIIRGNAPQTRRLYRPLYDLPSNPCYLSP